MAKNLRSINPSEHQIQSAIVDWANHTFITHKRVGKVRIGDYLIKIPNEGKRSFNQGKKMKKEGLKKGVSDLFLAYPSCLCNSYGLWIEIKKKGAKLSNEQFEFLSKMSDVEYKASWVFTVDDGINLIKEYLGI